MPIMKDQCLPILQRIGFNLVRHLAEGVFHKTLLQHGLFGFGPAPKYRFGKSDLFATTICDLLVRDLLRQFAQLIETFWATFAIDARIAFDESFSSNAATLLRCCLQRVAVITLSHFVVSSVFSFTFHFDLSFRFLALLKACVPCSGSRWK